MRIPRWSIHVTMSDVCSITTDEVVDEVLEPNSDIAGHLDCVLRAEKTPQLAYELQLATAEHAVLEVFLDVVVFGDVELLVEEAPQFAHRLATTDQRLHVDSVLGSRPRLKLVAGGRVIRPASSA